MKLTEMEIQFLNGMRSNTFCDLLVDPCGWLFSVVDECPYTDKQATGVVSSLVQKELIFTDYLSDEGLYVVGFTPLGKTLFNTADGEPCVWGGKPLLKID